MNTYEIKPWDGERSISVMTNGLRWMLWIGRDSMGATGSIEFLPMDVRTIDDVERLLEARFAARLSPYENVPPEVQP